jgi:hypothetical protein
VREPQFVHLLQRAAADLLDMEPAISARHLARGVEVDPELLALRLDRLEELPRRALLVALRRRGDE